MHPLFGGSVVGHVSGQRACPFSPPTLPRSLPVLSWEPVRPPLPLCQELACPPLLPACPPSPPTPTHCTLHHVRALSSEMLDNLKYIHNTFGLHSLNGSAERTEGSCSPDPSTTKNTYSVKLLYSCDTGTPSLPL